MSDVRWPKRATTQTKKYNANKKNCEHTKIKLNTNKKPKCKQKSTKRT